MCTVFPEMVAGPEAMLKFTASPDDAVALTPKSPAPKVLSAIAAKLIDWSALFTVCASAADVLGAEALSPSYDAVNECVPAFRELSTNFACPLASSVALPMAFPASSSVTLPVGVGLWPLLTVAVMVTGSPKVDGFEFDISVVLVFAVKKISSTGCSSTPLAATPLCPWMKSKKPTPFTRTGTLAVWNTGVAAKRASNFCRAAEMNELRGLEAPTQAGRGISAIRVLLGLLKSCSTMW